MSRRFYILLGVLAIANVCLLFDSWAKCSEIDSLFTLNRLQQAEIDELKSMDRSLSYYDTVIRQEIKNVDTRQRSLWDVVQNMNSPETKEANFYFWMHQWQKAKSIPGAE